ncbi:glucose PTS transporter subunit IIA [Halalkalibacter krulwichiae]|uniref:PTS system beta-glucoside-specific EIIBCA component n=1 Tax=Halalkalibacter krulwichiae TaxID=199441 RepID=A0A1X9MH77_9BACI|nr:glucose PTS transporter subunit IIA [Halalkalibacter krulwichiae]ARK29792.1 PTS system beta-glucoside-specific EIIBCA component [Halalkalibacter krulwichiae]
MKNQNKETMLAKTLDIISGSFTPIIGLLAGAGLLKAFLSVLTMLGWLSPGDGTYIVLSAAGNAVFHFLPVFLGVSTAIKLGVSGYVGGAVGASLFTPDIVHLVEGGVESIDFLGMPVLLNNYSSTVFPIFIAMFVYAGLERLLKKIIYKDIQMFINPMISLLVLVPLTLLVFGPVGTIFGEGLASIIDSLSSRSGLLAGAVLGSAWTFLNILGLHWTIVPIALANLATGPDPIIAMAAAAPFAQVGIGAAVFLKTRDTDLKALSASGVVPGALAGTTDAISYGIILRFRRTMIYVAIAGAIGGAINGSMGIVMNTFVLPSMLSIPAFTPIWLYIIGVSTACIIGFLLTFIFGFENKSEKKNENGLLFGVKPETITSPMQGKVVPLHTMNEPLFSTEMVGKGVAIEPDSGQVFSPVDGVVTTLFPTGHAIGITSKDGAEILVYIGTDTIQLKGKYFTQHVKQGDSVKQGDLLIEFNLDELKAAGYQLTTPVVITNTNEYQEVESLKHDSVDSKSKLLKLTV